MRYFQEDGLVIKSWCDDPEQSAVDQALNLARLPFAFHHIATMPDMHTGMGMPVGGVLATKDVIVPNAIGSDVSCGMCAVKTPWTTEEISRETLKKIMGEIRHVIPVGFNKHKVSQDSYLMPSAPYGSGSAPVFEKEYKNALLSLASLGSGNHFLEIQYDSNKLVWIMIHSGSRNLGYKVCEHYDKLAIDLNKRWHSIVPASWKLAYLPVDSEEGQAYLREMEICGKFAFANRKLMMDRIASIFDLVVGYRQVDLSSMINIAHNYARLENHFGSNVWVHRKGATSARAGEIGIIPGSQGTVSYIVKGKGNPDSFMSCSHGAGRKMSRTVAKKTLDLATEQKILDDQGIIHSIRGVSDLDEASGSYKDISTVISAQLDLIEVVEELKTMAVIKG